MTPELVKAIFAAGFRAGKEAGIDAATAFEWGAGNRDPQPDVAWRDHIAWRLETDTSYRLDVNSVEQWADIP